jgi:hypothetical protein
MDGNAFAAVNRSALAMLRASFRYARRLWLLTTKACAIRDLPMITLLIIFLVALVLVAGYLLFFAH